MSDHSLTEICASVRDVFDARAAICGLVEADATLHMVAGDGDGVKELIGVRVPVGEGITGFVAETGVSVEVADVVHDERFAARLAQGKPYIPESLMCAPLVGEDGRVLGVLNILDPSAEVVEEVRSAAGGTLPVLGLIAAELARVLETRASGPAAAPADGSRPLRAVDG